MSIDANNPIAAAGRALASANPDADRQEIKRLAQQFEAMLMTQMLREMRRSMLDDDSEQGGLGAGAMIDTGDIEFGNAMSRDGGLGFANEMLGVFERQIAALSGKSVIGGAAGTGSVTAASGPADPAADPLAVTPDSARGLRARVQRDLAAASGVTLAPTPGSDPAADLAAPVSSGFGWRRDPLTGAARFHSGVDLAVAYGRPVKAAADGVVAFAGTQNGYGQTVVIDHGNGRQTRYAHLSEPLVQAGDTVAEGQVVGKSGNSGRSTGPHLHFEMLVNGRAVDPRSGQL